MVNIYSQEVLKSHCSKKAITLLKRFRNNFDNDNHVILDQFLTLKIFSTTLGKWLLSVQFYFYIKSNFPISGKIIILNGYGQFFESDWKILWLICSYAKSHLDISHLTKQFLSYSLIRENVYIFRRIKIGKEFLFIHGKNLTWSNCRCASFNNKFLGPEIF